VNRRMVVLTLIPVGVIVLAFEAPRAFFQDAGAADDAVAAPGKYFGASTCDGASCHSKPEPRKDPPFLQEFTCWNTVNDGVPQDRHSYAFKRLKPKDKGGDERSPAIMKKLAELEKISTTETAETSERCLTCHGVAIHDYGVGKKNPGAAIGKHKELQGAKYRADDGVSCDGCHGPAEKWLKKHDKKEWTTKEWAKLGGKSGGSQKLYDDNGIYYSKDLELWANQCVRCHLRIDTNMIEAGHPDLNPFELFSQSLYMPAHWRDYTTATPSPELPGAGPMHASLIWQTGQTAAFRSALEQVGIRAKGDKFNKAGDATRMAEALERTKGHWTVLRHAMARISADDAKAIDEMMEKLDDKTAAESAPKLVEKVTPLVRKAADHKNDIGHVTTVMKALVEDAALLANATTATQGAKALYALNYSRLAQTNAEALAANPPTDAVMKAVYAMLEAPDPKGDAFKKALEEIKGALK
jgi:hypothetical protein